MRWISSGIGFIEVKMKFEKCWCNLKFHFPGEKKRHLKAEEEAKKILKIVDEVHGRSSNR